MNLFDFLNPGAQPPSNQVWGQQTPGPIGGFAGGTWNMDGSQATPVHPPQQQMAPASGAELADPANDEIMVDGWKPKKPSTLGIIADVLLGTPIFSGKVRRQNMQDAMQGFTQDPLNSIRRLAQIPGMQEKAYQMYEHYKDDTRQDETALSMKESRQDKYLTRMGGLLNRIKGAKDPNAAYAGALPILQQLAKRGGIDNLPTEYDSDYADNFISSSITPEDQVRMSALEEYRKNKLGLDERKFESQDQYRQERLKDFDEANNLKARGLDMKARDPKKVFGGKAYKDSNGSLVEFDDSGKKMKVTSADGNTIAFVRMTPEGRPVLVRQMTKAEYEAEKAKGKK